MFQTLDEAASFIRHKSVAMVDLKFCDLWGRWRHVTLPAGRFNPSLIESGVGFDGSSLGLTAVKSGRPGPRPRARDRVPRPVLGGADHQLPLRDAGGRHAPALSPRPADPRRARRGVPAHVRGRANPASGGRSSSSTSSTA